MRTNSFLLFIAAIITIAGCSKTVEVVVDSLNDEAQPSLIEQPTEEVGFTLFATNGDPDTKLSFDADGLNTTWQPGDKLYIMDLNQSIANIEMTTDITEPSKSAKFTSQNAVLPGNYIVVYGATSFTGNSRTLQLATTESLGDRLLLVAPLTVADGQTSASLSLKHAFAMLTFTFSGIPSDLQEMRFGMAAAKGLQTSYSASFSTDGWSAPYSPILSFSPDSYFSQQNGSSAKVLIAPSDLSGDKAYFYLRGMRNGRNVFYEIVKDGKNLKAGINYNINLNFSAATQTELVAPDGYYSLRTPADFRAALYLSYDGKSDFWERTYTGYSFSLENDIDFQGASYLPIFGGIKGNSHILDNVHINMEKTSNVGIVGNGSVSDLIVKNAFIKGRSNVGGIAGFGYASNCGFEGEVEGTSNNVGGISGMAFGNSTKCYVVGSVKGADNVGGIIGNAYWFRSGSGSRNSYVYDSYVIGNISGDSNFVGGIIGVDGYVRRSYSCVSVSSGCGISGNNAYEESTCLTSLSRMGSNSQVSDNCNCGPNKTFLSKLSVINGNEAYSTQVWSNIDAGCPLLRWQADKFGGDIVAPGFGNEDW